MRVVKTILAMPLIVVFAYGSEFPICDADFDQEYCAIAFDGSNYLVVWQDARNGTWSDVYGARVTPSGTVIDPDGIPISTSWETQREPAVAFGDENYFVVWRDSRDGSYTNIYGARVSPSGTVLDPSGILISEDIRTSREPSIAFDGTNYLVVWIEDRWNEFNIWGVRIDQLGNRLDAEDFCISDAALYDAKRVPSVSFGGTDYLVVWADSRSGVDWDIYGRRVGQDGTLYGPSGGFPITEVLYNQNHPDIAFDGTNFFVVWVDARNFGLIDIYGTRVSTSGAVLDPNGIPICVALGDQGSPSIDFDGKHYLIAWKDNRLGPSIIDIMGTIVDTTGNVLDEEGFDISTYHTTQYDPCVAADGISFLVGWEDERYDFDIWGKIVNPNDFLPDAFALAYNGNKHFVRAFTPSVFHLIYSTPNGIYYRSSYDEGPTWGNALCLGAGKYPSMNLTDDDLPVVTWTDSDGGLWYARQWIGGDWIVYHLYDPSSYDPLINAPPSIVVTQSPADDTVHILATLLFEDIDHLYAGIVEFSFSYDNPWLNYDMAIIEGGQVPDHKFCYYPSLTKDYQKRLHAVWQRSDTICYATREVNRPWANWGPRFGDDGLQSAQPFVETYGDRVFVTWQHQEASGKDDVYKGWRYLDWPDWRWGNLSLTATESQYAVNASGLVTTFIDEEVPTPPDGGYEVYWKRTPSDPLNNISETPRINSMYPQTALRYNQIADNELFVVWQEGNIAPYQIKFKKVYVPDTVPAFFSSLNGNPQPSAYVTSRDTFNDTWAVPVDIGNNAIGYQFYLEPGYSYRVKTTAYHEFGGQCKARLKVDNTLEYLVQYNSGIPKSLEAWIPAQLYADSVIEVSFERIMGAGVTLGPIYVYRYEDGAMPGPSGGIMAYSEDDFIESSIDVAPTVFTHDLSIRLQTDRNIDVMAHIYDVTGRLVYDFGSWSTNKNSVVRWSGEDSMGRRVAPGIYFVQVKDIHTNQQYCFKVLMIR